MLDNVNCVVILLERNILPNIEIKIKNLDEFERAMRNAPRIIGCGLQRAIQLSANLFLRDVKDNIRTGLEMWKPPLDTGLMRSSIITNIGALRAEIFPTVNYAIYVHEGTRFMRERPFLEITARHSADSINNIFEDQLALALAEVDRA